MKCNIAPPAFSDGQIWNGIMENHQKNHSDTGISHSDTGTKIMKTQKTMEYVPPGA